MDDVVTKKCLHDGCKTHPCCNYPGNTTRLYCVEHRKDGMERITYKKCSYNNCTKQPSFGKPGTKPTRCSEHQESGMLNLVNKHCQYEGGCNTIAHYNNPDQVAPRFCKTHAGDDMIIVTRNKCSHQICGKAATHNESGKTRPIFCSEHSQSDMVNVVSKRCSHENCNKHPSFNYSDKSTPVVCSTHRSDGMVCVTSKICEHPNCSINASFDEPGIRRGKFCKKHRLAGMVSIKTRFCEHPNCFVSRSFNYPGEKKGRFCLSHREENMIDVTAKRCKYEGCETQPVFNYPSIRTPIYCNDHKLPNMQNVTQKPCIYPECTKSRSFNIPGQPPAFCKAHKTDEMNYSRGARKGKCKKPKCKNLATHGTTGGKAIYCIDHKDENMVDIVFFNKCCVPDCDNEHKFDTKQGKFCPEHCPIEIKSAAKRLCKYCDLEFDLTHICDDCKQKAHKIESTVVRYLRQTINTPFIHDASIMLNDCSKKRPDVYFDLPNKQHCVIVEIDENQHRNYDQICERARICEIVGGIAGRSVVIIRFNPDTIKSGKRKVEISFKERLECLVNVIKAELVKDYDTFFVKTIHLYYDGSGSKKYQHMKVTDITDIVAV